jgi:hypothetical protein
MARKEPVQAVAYLRTSSAANVGADKDSWTATMTRRSGVPIM